jgi:hypothetical protein
LLQNFALIEKGDYSKQSFEGNLSERYVKTTIKMAAFFVYSLQLKLLKINVTISWFMCLSILLWRHMEAWR